MILVRSVLIMLLILMFATPEGLDSCAIGEPEPVFINHQGPPNRLNFLDGKLGILRPSFEPRHLLAAFRILTGVPLTQAEKNSLYVDQRDIGIDYSYPQVEWTTARRAVTGAGPAPEVNPYAALHRKRNGLIQNYENCKKDSFRTAMATLDELSEGWGKDDAKLIEWVRAQDQVFSNCSDATANIPAEPTPDADPLFAAHRRYQIAAALFYAGQHRRAAEAFDSIAKDDDSPWREFAPYLAGRALLRAGLLDGDMDAFRDGEKRLLAIIDDPNLEDWHEHARQLVELWRIRVEPLRRVGELSSQLMTPGTEDISQPVIDLLYLVGGRTYGGGMSWSKEETSEVEKSSELAAWLLSMSSRPPADAGERALEWWRKDHRPVWLISALINGTDRDVPELIAAAEGLKPGSPEFVSVTYFATIRAMKLRQYDRARKIADRALQQKLEITSQNSFRELRLRLARNFGEFLRFVGRRADPSLALFEGHEVEGTHDSRWPEASIFDWDGIDAFNLQLPLALWHQASTSPTLSAEMRLRISEAGWVRALVLGRSDEARKFMERIVALNPSAASVGANYLAAADAKEAQFGAVYIALRTPGLAPILGVPDAPAPNLSRAQNYGWGADFYRYDRSSGQNFSKPSTNPLPFLTAADRSVAGAEWSKVRASTPWDATYLLRQTLEWSRLHPDDKRVPEALHRAVMASFFRPGGKDMGKYSKQAWEMLHHQFPNSEWTARTPYWYK
jgi:tetratricopeptide (TPR) repeat protein